MEDILNVYTKEMRQIADFTRLKNELPDVFNFINGNEPIIKLFDINTNIPTTRIKLYKNLYLGIGDTKCYTVHLNNNNILRIKMEYSNPVGNTHYSRYWIPYLYIAELLNFISPYKTNLLEVSSGNAGIALAMCAKKLGYNVTMVLPKILPTKGRIEPIKFYGANVILVDGYITECMFRLKRLIVSGDYFATNHSEEKSDLLIKIMKRIAHEFYIEHGVPDYLISGIGNGTSTLALFNYFKALPNKKPEFIGYYPTKNDSDFVLGLYKNQTKLRHIKDAVESCKRIYSTEELKIASVKDNFKYDTEIINLGFSSLYGIAIAIEIAKEVHNKTFFTLGYDKIDRYINT